MGRPPEALPARLVHGAGDRAAPSTNVRWAARRPWLRRPLARLGIGLDRATASARRRHRHRRGRRGAVDMLAGSAPDEAVYLDSLRAAATSPCCSCSTSRVSVAEPGATGANGARATAGAAAAHCTVALHELGDRVALYAFQSQGRSAVHVAPGEALRRQPGRAGDAAPRRPRPGRLLAAGRRDPTRHGGDRARRPERRGGCSSCCPMGWRTTTATNACTGQPMRGAPSPRPAGSGIGCLCLTIGASTDAEELRPRVRQRRARRDPEPSS